MTEQQMIEILNENDDRYIYRKNSASEYYDTHYAIDGCNDYIHQSQLDRWIKKGLIEAYRDTKAGSRYYKLKRNL